MPSQKLFTQIEVEKFLATERSKWVAEIKTELLYAIEDSDLATIQLILNLPSLTPPPKGETV